MARKNQLAEFNTFVGGLVTEASPLTFPPNASLNESNFELLRNGSRKRRLGMDLEDDWQAVTLTSYAGTVDPDINTYKWSNAGGDPNKTILVVQFANRLRFFDMSVSPLSSGLIYSTTITGRAGKAGNYSFSSVDGYLVAATGEDRVRVYQIDSSNNITSSLKNLRIRDLFGIDDDYQSVSTITLRPSILTSYHMYNLRNQGWAIPRKGFYDEEIRDPITIFNIEADYQDLYGDFPSNADNIAYSIYADVNDSDDRITRRFHPKDMLANPVGTTSAPKGFFIIDAINRGASRTSAYADMLDSYPELTYNLSISLPTDATIDADGDLTGASVVETFSGRVFYAGFSSRLSSGDDLSPLMGNYVLFSKLVNNLDDLGKCYQEGDPTSLDNSDLVDTDGGFLKISECQGITKMSNLNNKLVVFANNGVWYITGGSDYGFTATDYKVVKITDRGCRNPRSIVTVGDAIMYWAEDGIYQIAPNQYGDLTASNISAKNINSLYTEISSTDKNYADGTYDSFERKVRWLYGNRALNTGDVRELILDIDLGAFYVHTIASTTGNIPKVVSSFVTPSYRTSSYSDTITYLGETITYSGEDITYERPITGVGVREVMYLTLTDITGVQSCSFSLYKDPTFFDWYSFNNVGVDAEAFMYTGYMSGDTFQLNKQVPYITFHLERTETGFDTIAGELVPTNQSSCKVRALWDWSDDVNSGRWGQEFQAYRYLRHWIPATAGSEYNYGQSVITTKNKLRGRGKVLSLYIHTDPGKDCRLLGWSMMVSVDGNV